MIQKIVSATDPKLRGVTKKVLKYDKKLKEIITDLTDTLNAQDDPEGVGLAGPQIGKLVKIFAMKPKKKGPVRIIINPELKSSKNDPKAKAPKDILEGCLSLPHYYGPLKRHNKIVITHDVLEEINGSWQLKNKEESFEGFDAHIVLHEIDHLNGILFIDRLFAAKKKLYKINKDKSWEEVELV